MVWWICCNSQTGENPACKACLCILHQWVRVPCRQCSRCQPGVRTLLQSEPPELCTVWSECPLWSVCAGKERGTVWLVWRENKREEEMTVKKDSHHPACISQISDLHSDLVCVLGIQRTQDKVGGAECWNLKKEKSVKPDWFNCCLC